MSYAAIEVEGREGKLIARGAEPSPKSGAGLLAILSERGAEPVREGGQPALAAIRQRQAARAQIPRTPDAVARQTEDERESWS